MIIPILSLIITTQTPTWKTNVALTQTSLITTSQKLSISHHIILKKRSIIDSLSNSLRILTLITHFLIILLSIKIKTSNTIPIYFILTISILRISLLLAFNVNTLTKFFIAFESSVLPTIIIILTWGYQPERLIATQFFIIYTIISSLPLLICIINIYIKTKTTKTTIPIFFNTTNIIKIFLILAFLVKLPLYLLHLWLPKAHVEAPVAGSIVLARVLLKLGSYGIIRIILSIPTLFNINTITKNLIIIIGLIGSIITATLCLRQHDIKEIVAYASVRHIRLIVASTLTNSPTGFYATIIINISHGLTRSFLFSLCTNIYETTNTRRIALTKGLNILAPSISMWWFARIIANGAAPPYINLLREITIFSCLTSNSTIHTPILIMIAFLSITYSIFILIRITHNKPPKSSHLLSLPNINHYSSSLHFIPLSILIFLPQLIENP